MEVVELPIDLLRDNPYDKRKKYGDIESLANSIKERGLQNPISVVKVDNYYIIVHGHRRTHAFRYLKRDKIPAIIRRESKPEDLRIDLAIENLQRKDLLPAERGATIEQLFYTIPNIKNNINLIYTLINQVKWYAKKGKTSEEFTEEDISEAKKLLNLVGISTTAAIRDLHICQLLPEFIQENVISGENANSIPEGKIVAKSAHELTRIGDPKLQKEVYQKILEDGLSHIEVKRLVDRLTDNNESIARIPSNGSITRRTEDDLGASKLTKDLYAINSRLEGFRTHLPLLSGRLEKAEWRSSLDIIKKSCLDTVRSINNLLRDDLEEEDLLETANSDIEIIIRSDRRYRFPANLAEDLRLKDGDKLLIKIEGIIKKDISSNRHASTDIVPVMA